MMKRKREARPRGIDGFVQTISDSDYDSVSSEESLINVESRRTQNQQSTEFQTDDLDPDFAFQFEGDNTFGAIPEAWEFKDVPDYFKSKAKGVDVDSIIRRKRENDLEEKQSGLHIFKASYPVDSGVVNNVVSDNEYVERDETSLPGGGETSATDEPETESISDELEFGGAAEDDYVDHLSSESSAEHSDESSVAEPVSHPDDLSDDSGSDTAGSDPEAEARKVAFFAPEEKSSEPVSNEFQSMNLSRPILRGLANVGFSKPTPIQTKAIPVALLGKDVVGGAVTGSGKTAAFVVPILERLLYRPRKVPTSRVVILCPTRELAIQCHSMSVKLASYTDIKFCLCVGGLSLKVQEAQLRSRPDIIIATPGRFIDHLRNTHSFSVENVEILVLDEADRMLEDGFADELNQIVQTIPASRQSMLFSATMTDSIDQLIKLSLNRPVRLLVDAKKSTASGLVQEFVRVRPQNEHLRTAMLILVCTRLFTSRVIIFLRSKVFAHRLRIMFGLLDLKAGELHGNLSQDQRIGAVESFRDGKIDFLLATDLASRGLDIKGIEVVINFEAPQSHDLYVHRVGRTARAGRVGRSITFVGENDRKTVKEAIKTSQIQGSKIGSRTLEQEEVQASYAKVQSLDKSIDEVLALEKEERALQQADMELRKSKNLIIYEKEIHSKPKRTWFESEQQKKKSSGS